MKKVLLAGFYHESHCFTEDVTGLDDFRIFRGQALLDRRGDGSQVDGFLTVAEREGWRVIPAVTYEAMPSGLVDHDAFEKFWSEVAPVLIDAVADGLDAVLLSLHGAVVTTKEADPEGELLRRICAVPGAESIVIYGVLDLHANLTAVMGRHADCLVAYHENPHTDARERAVHVAELLARYFKNGKRPRMRVLSAPILWPPTGTDTADAPMRILEEAARKTEEEYPGILAVSVIGGYSFSDVYETGVAFGIVTEGEPEPAGAALAELVQTAWQWRFEGLPGEWDLDEILREIVPVEKGPVLLVESADNIGGGAPGDCTDVLRALLRYEVTDAGVIMADAEAVKDLREVPIGGSATLKIGGKGSSLDPGPVEFEVQLVSRSDGRFRLEDRNSHLAGAFGIDMEMGPSAVVRHKGVTILLNSRKTPPFDLGQWRSQGINPEELKVIGVKAAVAHRRAYNPIAAASYTVKSRGPCASDPRLLPYRRVRRPIFPLDSMETVNG